MGSRRKGRVLAVQALYAWEMTRIDTHELCRFVWLDEEQEQRYDAETRQFASLLITGVIERLSDVDETIKSHLEHWNFDRIAKVDLAVLRLGVYSLLFQPGIPTSVTIDEAVEIAKEYSGDDAYRFVNGILDGVRKARVRNGA